jgi:hypothetical protein
MPGAVHFRFLYHTCAIHYHQAPMEISTGGLKKMCYTCVTLIHTSIFPCLFNVQSREFCYAGECEKTGAQESSPVAYAHRTCEDTWCRTIRCEPVNPGNGESRARGMPDTG